MKLDYRKLLKLFVEQTGIRPGNCYQAFVKGYRAGKLSINDVKKEKVNFDRNSRICYNCFYFAPNRGNSSYNECYFYGLLKNPDSECDGYGFKHVNKD